MAALLIRHRLGTMLSVGVLLAGACTGGGVASTPTATLPTSEKPTGASPTPTASAPATGRIDLSSLTGRIAFSGGPPHAEDVFLINANGTGLARVTSDPAADFDPTWSPDGTRIAYRHQPGDDSTTDIDVIEADGSAARDVTRNDGVSDWGPSWSPDGRRIAWNSDRGRPGTFRGYLMNPDGSDVRPLGADVWVEYPAWSPDGTKLSFMGQTPEGTENYEIYLVRADGTGLRRLTDSPGPDGWPAWSPDGRRILFSSVRDDCTYSDAPDCKTTGDIGPYHTLYVMNADGINQTRLSDVYGQIADWSPNGRYIVFEGQGGLSIMRADGSGLTTLPISVSSAAFPDWTS
jgi:Tol biopolymer transport system component